MIVFKGRKIKPLFFLIILGLITVIGSTFAYYYTNRSIENKFNISDYSLNIKSTVEDFQCVYNDIFGGNYGGEEKDINFSIHNDGEAPVLLRVFYTEKVFVNSCDGCEYEQLDSLYYGDDLVEKYWNDDFYDFVYHDGWYYYTKVLNSNEYVDILDGTHHEKQEILIDFNDSYYDIDFYYEVVQVKNNASEEVWGYSADIDGNNVDWNF